MHIQLSKFIVLTDFLKSFKFKVFLGKLTISIANINIDSFSLDTSYLHIRYNTGPLLFSKFFQVF